MLETLSTPLRFLGKNIVLACQLAPLFPPKWVCRNLATRSESDRIVRQVSERLRSRQQPTSCCLGAQAPYSERSVLAKLLRPQQAPRFDTPGSAWLKGNVYRR